MVDCWYYVYCLFCVDILLVDCWYFVYCLFCVDTLLVDCWYSVGSVLVLCLLFICVDTLLAIAQGAGGYRSDLVYIMYIKRKGQELG